MDEQNRSLGMGILRMYMQLMNRFFFDQLLLLTMPLAKATYQISPIHFPSGFLPPAFPDAFSRPSEFPLVCSVESRLVPP